MVTYMSPFMPHLSEHTANLRDLLKKDNEYTWKESHEKDFQQIKDLIRKEVTLVYFNPTKPTTIQQLSKLLLLVSWERHYYKTINQLHFRPSRSP